MNKKELKEKVVNYVYVFWLDSECNEILIFDTLESANNYMERHCVFKHPIDKLEVINYCR